MKKAIVVDLDDTLLRYDKTVSEFTKATLAKCSAAGVKLLFATGRGSSAVQLAPTELFDGHVLYNGAYAQVGDIAVYKKLISPGVYLPFLQRMNSLGLRAAAEIGGVHYANFDVNSMWARRCVLTNFTDIKEESEKLYVILEAPADSDLVSRWLPEGLYAHFTKDNLALIMDSDATKIKALTAVLGHMGIALADVVAFGDDVNDCGMLAACGTGVAMGNALDEVKAVADTVCADCDHDGVAHWLQANIL